MRTKKKKKKKKKGKRKEKKTDHTIQQLLRTRRENKIQKHAKDESEYYGSE